jgi:hypothetical protein
VRDDILGDSVMRKKEAGNLCQMWGRGAGFLWSNIEKLKVTLHANVLSEIIKFYSRMKIT